MYLFNQKIKINANPASWLFLSIISMDFLDSLQQIQQQVEPYRKQILYPMSLTTANLSVHL